MEECQGILKQKDKANAFVSKGDFESAEQLLIGLIPLVPDIPMKSHVQALLNSNLSFVFLQRNNLAEAKRAAEDSIRLCPTWIKGYLRLIDVHAVIDKQCHCSETETKERKIQLDTKIEILSRGITEAEKHHGHKADTMDETCNVSIVNDPKDIRRAKDLLEKYRNGLHELCPVSRQNLPSATLQSFQNWMTNENPNGVRGLEINEHTPINRSVTCNKTLYDQSIVLSIPVRVFFVRLNVCCFFFLVLMHRSSITQTGKDDHVHGQGTKGTAADHGNAS